MSQPKPRLRLFLACWIACLCSATHAANSEKVYACNFAELLSSHTLRSQPTATKKEYDYPGESAEGGRVTATVVRGVVQEFAVELFGESGRLKGSIRTIGKDYRADFTFVDYKEPLPKLPVVELKRQNIRIVRCGGVLLADLPTARVQQSASSDQIQTVIALIERCKNFLELKGLDFEKRVR